MKTFAKINPFLAILLAAALLVALLVTFWPGSEKKYVTADFPRTVSLYEGSDVKILGVAVGTVDSVVPAGTRVKVKFSYDAKYKIPATIWIRGEALLRRIWGNAAGRRIQSIFRDRPVSQRSAHKH